MKSKWALICLFSIFPACADDHADVNRAQSTGVPSTESDKALVAACLPTAVQRISLAAKGRGCSVNTNQIRSDYINNDWYRPHSYIWYNASATCPNDKVEKIQVMVQYSFGKCI